MSLCAQIRILDLKFEDHTAGGSNLALNIPSEEHNEFPYTNTKAELVVRLEVTDVNLPLYSSLKLTFPNTSLVNMDTNGGNPNGIYSTPAGISHLSTFMSTQTSPNSIIRFEFASPFPTLGIYTVKVKVNAVNSGTSPIAVTASLTFGAISPADVVLGLDVANEVLPVELGEFTAALFETNKGLLDWNTLSEKNTKEFIIEKSRDAINWSYLSTQVSKAENGYSNWKLDYQYIDPQLFNGTNFYRIKMIDYDGTYSYSPIRVINYRNGENYINVYPNPASDVVHINNIGVNSTIQLVDIAGRQVPVSILENNGSATVDVSKLTGGSYFIIMTNNILIEKRKLIVIK